MVKNEKPNKNVKIGDIGSIEAREALFYLGLILWIFTTIIQNTFFAAGIPNGISTLIRLFSVFLIIISEIENRFDYRAAILGIILIILAYCYYKADSQGSYYDQLLIIYASRKYPLERTARVALLVTTIILLITTVASQFGIIHDYIYMTVHRTRHYLGFTYALIPAQLVFQISCLIVYLKKYDFKIRHALIILILNQYYFNMTDSRLSYYFTLVLITLALIAAFIKRKARDESIIKKITIILVPSYIACAFISIFLTLNFKWSSFAMVSLNSFLGSRLSLGLNAVKQYGITLFGQPIEMVGMGLNAQGYMNYSGYYNYIDSAYVRALVNYGTIFLIIIATLLTLVLYLSWKNGNYILVIVLSLIAAHCMVDDLAFRAQYNIMLLSISTVLVTHFPPHVSLTRRWSGKKCQTMTT